ncbi:MAG: hypothetical protein JXR89_00550 [Deltaproteobacteria bacterium]|nr:hypothetical protein [Deltaproteobacteria bacterium]
MKRKYFIFIVMAAVLSGACGQVTKETVSPVPTEKIQSAGKNMVVLPFADYTPDSSPELYWRRNLLVNEALTDELSRYGFRTAVDEDVVSYLIQERIIEAPELFFADTPNNNYMRDAVASGEWSAEMMQELNFAITRNEQLEKEAAKTTSHAEGSSAHISLNSREVAKIGNYFNADYIVRGRLIEFEKGAAKDDFNPFHVGMLPFFFNSSQRLFFGLAKSENYELMDKMAIGGILGTALGSANENFPIDEKRDTVTSGHPLFGATTTSIKDYHALNTALWGVAGVGAAYLAHNGGKVPRAVVQIRIMVQDARSGRLLWSNRSEVEVIPESFFAEQEYRKLVAKAIRRATASLVRSFVATVEGDLLVAPVAASDGKS